MTTIRIKEYRDSYSKEIESIFIKDMNYIPKISDTRYSLLLFENNLIIGIGSIWDNTVHPYRQYISVYIVPYKRGKGLGKLLFRELENRYKLKNLQTAFDSNNNNAVNFAKKCGFKLVRKCYCYNVNEELLKPYAYTCLGEIVELSNLCKIQFEYVIEMQYEDYKLNHQGINPLAQNITLQNWKDIIFDNLTKENSYVYIKNNSIAAYLLCYEIDETTIEVGYTGSRCNTIKDYETFLYKVIMKLFKSYNQLDLEIDDCDKSANILGELFSYKPNISWDAYVKDN